MKNKENQECPVPQGILVIIGGKENKGQRKEDTANSQNDRRLEILKAFVSLIGKDDPVLEVITSASGVEDESFEEYRKAFGELGIHRINHMHHNTRNEVLKDEALIDRAKDANAFFFSGGDQLLLTGLYGGTPFLSYLKERYIQEKIVIGGTSAGAMALSTPMIYAGSHEVQEIGGEIKITTGLEFLKDVCIDTHFVERGRFVRMAQAIVTNPSCIGLGIEEDTAIVVRSGVDGEVIGSGTIIVMEGFQIENSNLSEFGSQKAVSIHNLRVHILVRGEKYKIPQVNPPHK